MGREKASGESGGFFAGKILDFDLFPIITPVIMITVCSTERRRTKPSQMAIRSIEEFCRTHQIEYDMNGGADHANQ